MNDLDGVLDRIRAQMDLDSQAEHDILSEIRGHLEEAVSQARAEGLDEVQALDQAAARFGLGEEVGQRLQEAHAGRGTADAVVAAALPVVGALILRWLVLAPDGTPLAWSQLASRPGLWIVALAVLFLPLLKFPRWRYALAMWLIFWGLSVALAVGPVLR